MGNSQKGKNISGDMIQNSIVIKNSTLDEITKLLSNGHVSEAMRILEIQYNALGVSHPKYPYYALGLKRSGDRLIPYSKPMSKDAIEKYPPSIKGTFRLPSKYSQFKSFKELLDYSYMSQTDIDVDIVELKKMIGDEDDPFQDDIKQLLTDVEGTWKILHKEFPMARPYKVVIKDTDISYDYVMLKTIKIENRRVELSNKEQEIDIIFNVIFDLGTRKMDMSIKLNSNQKISHQLVLKFLKFTKYAGERKKLSIIPLEYDATLAEGVVDNLDYETPFDNIDNEIVFIEYIVLIESRFNREITIPEIIEKDDLDAIFYLGEALKYGSFKGNWTEGTLDFKLDDETIGNFLELEDKAYCFTLVVPIDVLIFGEIYHIPKVLKTFKMSKIKNLERLKRKLAVLDEGDTVKVVLEAGDDNSYEESFSFNS